jgi:predicted nucleic acid-binding protein
VKIIVADSCALILLSKSGLLKALTEGFRVIVPMAVFAEVVNPDTIGKFPDAKGLAVLADQTNIEVVTEALPHPDSQPPVTLGRGEWEAIRLVQRLGAGALLATDDGKAIKACRYLNLPFIISPKIATELYRKGRVDWSRAKTAIEKMRIEGRYAPDIIAEALLRLEEIRNAQTGNREGS